MSLTKSGTEDRIIESAVKLFAHQGFSATTTREIAHLADVNEGTLFRYFASKQELFSAALESEARKLRLGKELEAALYQNQDPEKVVPLIIGFLVQTVTYQPELVRLLRFSLLELKPTAEKVYRQQMAQIFRAVIAYIERSIERGAMRDFDPSIAAVGFLTTILSHQGIYELLLGRTAPFSSTDEAVFAYTKFWLRALTAEI